MKTLIQNLWYAVAHTTKSVAVFVAGKMRLRHRYFFTKEDKIRLRYLAIVAVLTVAAFGSFNAVSQKKWDTSSFDFDMASIELNEIEPAVGIDREQNEKLEGLLGQLSLANIMTNAPAQPTKRIVTIEPGDALGVVLEREGVGDFTPKAIKALAEHYDPKQIRAGQKIQLDFEPSAENGFEFASLQMKIDPLKTVVVKKKDDEIISELDKKEVKRSIRAKRAKIELSLYGSAAKAGIPKGVVADAMKIYSWNVDFERDLRKGDTLEVMYESYETEDGYVAKNGNVIYANLTVGGREIPLYRFKLSDGRTDYFQPSGWSIKRTLMKTPIDGARMSSGFGMRRHPVLGYNKMHRGVDFAAPTGTPIYAAGDGKVEKAGWFSSFGKYVRIRHNSQLKTAYAHMSKIKVKAGQRVKQGQVIGLVGSTGRSTGAHLHYEVHKNGTKVNPRSVNLPTGEKLAGNDMNKFKSVMKDVDRQFIALLDTKKYAQKEGQSRSANNMN